MNDSKKVWTTYKLYLLLASLVGLIGGLITGGSMLTTIGDRVLITNGEYVSQQQSYGVSDTKDQIITRRNYDFKREILRNSIRTLLFVTVFFTHYPRFRKQNNT